MSFELSGKLIESYPILQVSEKFRKREFVLETKDGEYSSFVKFQLIQDKCNLIDNLDLGTQLKVLFNIKGSKWEKDGKVSYFTNLDAWKVEILSKANNVDSQVPPPSDEDFAFSAPGDEDDDLPF